MSEIEVKALEWRDYPGSRLTGESKERYGFHEFGYYTITRGSGVYFLGTFTSMGKMRPMGGFKLLDEAKAAAQSDFDARIRSAIERKAEPVPAAWREAVQEFVDRVERGEVRSKRTYAKFKELLAGLSTPPAEPVQREYGYMRVVEVFDRNETAGAFLSEDGEGGFAAGVSRMADEIDRLRAVISASPAPPVTGASLTLAALQAAHVARQDEWCPDQKPDLSFRGNEMAGEVGEACNVVKKLERERHGWRGSRATTEQLAEELADVIHCAVLTAITAGIEIEPAVIAKFNSTSEKNGLATALSAAKEHRP